MLDDVGVLQEKLKNVVSQIDILQKEKKILEEQIIKTKEKCYKKMISIVNRWTTKDKNTNVAKLMFKALENGGRCLLSSEVNSKYIKNSGTFYHLTNDVDSRDWNLIFTQEGDYHCIKQEVIKYLAMKNPVKTRSPVKSKISDKVSIKAKSPIGSKVSTKAKNPVNKKVSDKVVSPRTANINMLNKTPFMRAKAKALLKQKRSQ